MLRKLSFVWLSICVSGFVGCVNLSEKEQGTRSSEAAEPKANPSQESFQSQSTLKRK